MTTTNTLDIAQLETLLRQLLRDDIPDTADLPPLDVSPEQQARLDDVLEAYRADKRRRRTFEMALHDFAKVASRTLERQELCEAMVMAAVRDFQACHAVLLLADRSGATLEPWACWHGEGPLDVPRDERGAPRRIPTGQGIAGQALHEGELVYVADLAQTPPHDPLETDRDQGSMISFPLREGPEVRGVLNMTFARANALNDVAVRQMELFCQLAGLALHGADARVMCAILERREMLAGMPAVEGDPWERLEIPSGAGDASRPILVAGCVGQQSLLLLDLLQRMGLPGRLVQSIDDISAHANARALLVDASSQGEDGWPLLLAQAHRPAPPCPVLLCGFDQRSGRAWLGRVDRLASKRADQADVLACLCHEKEHDTTRETALLVENNPLHAEHWRGVLAEHFARVYLADDGVAGVEQWLTHTPGAVCCDALMPDRCGLHLLAEIGRAAGTPRTVLLLPEHATPAECRLLAVDAQWTAGFHGVTLDRWLKLLTRALEAMPR